MARPQHPADGQAAVLFLQPLGAGRALATDLRQLFGLTAGQTIGLGELLDAARRGRSILND